MPSRPEKPELDRHSTLKPRPKRALVLGTGPIAERIARSLGQLGFQAVTAAPATDARALGEQLAALAQSSERGAALYLHPGISSWSERAELQSVGAQHGFHVVAPPPRALSLFSNKLNLL